MHHFPLSELLYIEASITLPLKRQCCTTTCKNDGGRLMKTNLPELVRQARQGDVFAFARLYEEIYKDLYRFAYCTVKNSHTAEDVVSDSVLNAYENIHKLRKNESFRSWMFQIVANECKRQFRLQSKTVPYETDVVRDIPQPAADPTDRLAIQQAFDLLNGQERLIVGLSLYGGYSGKEIARFLHKKESTVRSMKSRALDKMKQILEVSDDD